MKLSAVVRHVQGILESETAFAGVEILTSASAEYNRRVEEALRTKGLAIVIMQTSGELAGGKGPQLYLRNSIVVSVLENPAVNTGGLSCLEVVELVLEAVHQFGWETQKALQNVLTVDKPAYEAGPLDSGLVTYFCNFTVTTIQPNL